VVLVYFTLDGKGASALPVIGLYAAAAFRLIPSLNRILTSVNRLKQSVSSVHAVMDDLTHVEPPEAEGPGPTTPFAHEIRVRGVHYRYPGADREALAGVSLEIRRGEMVGFIGKSGSGKTTLVDCILGLLPPNQGEVCVDGVDIRNGLAAWRAQIGYIPQNIYLTDDTLRKNVALGLASGDIDDSRVARAIEAAQLAELVGTLPDGLETMIGERGVRLSGGQRQRIGIARAMYSDPQVLVLDEATSALDGATEKAIVNTIAGLKNEKTIIVIAHRMTTIADCDRVFVLEGGVLCQGDDANAGRATVRGPDR
jgi:ATP-binding cassette subfamily C protein